MKSRKSSKQAGFTLIEIMVVLVIIGILAAFIAPKLTDQAEGAKVTAAKHDVTRLKAALDMYRLQVGRYPTTAEGLRALVEKPADAPTWKEGGYIDNLPKDPWGNDYQYLNPGVHGTIDVFSYGADGQPGGEGANADIGNWTDE